MNAALARFDEEFKQANSYEILGIKVLKWIFTFLGMALMITIPFPTDKIMLLITWSFLWICVMCAIILKPIPCDECVCFLAKGTYLEEWDFAGISGFSVQNTLTHRYSPNFPQLHLRPLGARR